MILLEARQVSKSFTIESGILRRATGSVRALHRVDLKIAEGETVALLGGSGSGKTTLAKIIAGLLPSEDDQILWKGQALSSLNRRARAREIQMIFQDPFASLNPKLSVGSQLDEVLRVRGEGKFSAAEIRQRSEALMASVGLPADTLEHYPFQFSGGQRQRIAIARALAMEPTLLIADEPLSALDVTIQAQVLALFKDLKKRFKLTILFITHDLAVARHIADRVLVLKEGEVVEEGAPDKILTNPQHAYTQALLTAVPRLP